MSRRAGDAAPRMRARPAHIKAAHRPAIAAMAQHRPRRPHLVQRQLAVHDVAVDQAEIALQVERRVDLPRDDAAGKARRIGVDRGDDMVGRRLPRIVPAAPVGQLRRELLAEEAGDMARRRGQALVDSGRDQHLDDRLARPALALRVHEGAVHIIQARRDDDARLVMRARAGQAGEIGQVRQRHVHPERARPGAKALDALDEVRRQVGRVHHPLVQQLGPDIGDHRAADHLFPALQPHADRPVVLHQHARDRRLQADLHAHRADHARHRLRDRAHAAHHMAPGALLPVHLA